MRRTVTSSGSGMATRRMAIAESSAGRRTSSIGGTTRLTPTSDATVLRSRCGPSGSCPRRMPCSGPSGSRRGASRLRCGSICFVPADERPDLVGRILAEWRRADGLRGWPNRGSPFYERVGLSVIGDVASALGPHEREGLWRALAAMRRGWLQSKRSPGDVGYKSMCQAQAGLSRSMEAARRLDAVSQGVSLLPRIGDHRIRELAAAAVAGAVEPETFDPFVEAVRRIPPQRRAHAYERLVARLCELGNGPQALEIAAGIDWPDPRRRAFDLVGPTLARMPPDELAHLWRPRDGHSGLVRRLAVRSRPLLLGDIASLARSLAMVGGEEAVAETKQAIRDVTEWWP